MQKNEELISYVKQSHQEIILNKDEIYEGEVSNGKAQGKGMIKNKNYTLMGEWEQGQLNGFGIFNWNEGDFFEGNFDKGIPNGFGTYQNK